MLNDWLKSALKASGLKQVELSKALTDAVGRSVDPAAIGKLLRGERKMYADELIEIARICSYPLPHSGDGKVDRVDAMLAGIEKLETVENKHLYNISTMMLLSIGGSSKELHPDLLRRSIIIALMRAGVKNSPDEIWKAVNSLVQALTSTSPAVG